MVILWLKFTTFATLLSVAKALAVIRLGYCPQPPVKENFNITKYLGLWWEYERFPVPYEIRAICVSAKYSEITTRRFAVFISGLQDFRFLGLPLFPMTALGEAIILHDHEPSKLRVTFGEMSANSKSDEPNYLVVDTDYENYSVVFSCNEIAPFVNIHSSKGANTGRVVSPRSIMVHHSFRSRVACRARKQNIDYPSNITLLTDGCPPRSVVELFPTALPNDTCGYYISSAFFQTTWSREYQDDLITPSANIRTKFFSKVRSKVIVSPRRVFEICIHHISKQLQEHWLPRLFNSSLAFLHHYRMCVSDYGMEYSQVVKDTIIMDKYMPRLKQNFLRPVHILRLPSR